MPSGGPPPSDARSGLSRPLSRLRPRAADLRRLPAGARRAAGSPPACRSGCRRTCRRRSSSSSGARRSGVVRRALHELKYSGEQRLAVPLGRPSLAAGPAPGRAATCSSRFPSTLSARGVAATTRRSSSPVLPPATCGLPCAPILERARATTAQFDLDRAERATNVPARSGSSRAAAARTADPERGRSRAAGSSSSTTSSRPARRSPRAPLLCSTPARSACRRSRSPASAEPGPRAVRSPARPGRPPPGVDSEGGGSHPSIPPADPRPA